MKTKPFEKLEVGKTYLSRDRVEVEIVERDRSDSIFPFKGDNGEWFTSRGYFHEDEGEQDTRDLILEVISDDVITPGEYLTNSGLTAVVLATSAPDKEYPIIGYVIINPSHVEEIHWTVKGEWIAGKKSPRDLVLTPPAAPSLRDAAEALLAAYEDLYKKLHDYLASPDKEPVVQNFKSALAADTSNTPQS